MPSMDLKQDFRYTDGRLYRKGQGVSVPDGFAAWLGGTSEEQAPPAAPQSATPEGGSAESALSGVDFASDEAAELANAEGLTAADFEGQKGSGANGFTKPDVRRIAAAKQEQE